MNDALVCDMINADQLNYTSPTLTLWHDPEVKDYVAGDQE